MSTLTNLGIYRVVFITAIFVIVCEAAEMKFTKNAHYSNLLPTNTSIYLFEAEDVRLSECALQCSIFQSACTGIFYNEFLESCKALRSGLPGILAFVNRTGWNFLRNYCDIGWDFYDGHCYFFNETETRWLNAKTLCQAQSAYLVEIDSIEENAWINEKVGTGTCSPRWQSCLAWTGGNDRETEGLFLWSRGTEMNFTFWLPTEPNSVTEGDDCTVIMHPGGNWADLSCNSPRPYLCEKAV